MAAMQRVGDLEIGQDLQFQSYQYTAQRYGWLAMLLLVVAALLGLLGRGFFSHTTAGDADSPLRVEYDRFLRRLNPTTLRLHLKPEVARQGEVRLWLDRDYLENFQVQQVTPRPLHDEAGDDRHVFIFRLARPDEATVIVFHLEAEEIGPLSGRAGVGDGEPVSFQQFVYP